MRPLRICLVSKEYPPGGVGGNSTYTYYLAHGLAAAGNEVTVVAGDKSQEKNLSICEQVGGGSMQSAADRQPNQLCQLSKLESSRVDLHYVHNHRIPLPDLMKRRPRGLWDVLERSMAVDKKVAQLERAKGRFDVVEMPNGGPEAFFFSLHPRAPLVIRMSTPLVVSNQFKTPPSKRLGFRLHCMLEAFAARRAAICVANSHYNAESCAVHYNLPVTNIPVIHLGIPAPSHLPTKRKGDCESVTILYVGRLQRRKGIHLLLQAISLVVEKLHNVRFIIAGLDSGDAPPLRAAPSLSLRELTYEDYFARTANSAALRSTTFLGYVDEETLDHLYADCDVLVAPSLFESFGLMYVEAMARAKPVVAFNIGAAREIVLHGETGFLVKPRNVRGLADAIVTLAKDKVMRHEMGRRGYERARARFSVQHMVEETIACYSRVISDYGSGSSHDFV